LTINITRTLHRIKTAKVLIILNLDVQFCLAINYQKTVLKSVLVFFHFHKYKMFRINIVKIKQ